MGFICPKCRGISLEITSTIELPPDSRSDEITVQILKCTKCGFDHHAALDFHHEDPTEKEYNVNRLVSDGRFKKAYAEIEKCIVLCANCHRIHHYEEKKKPPSLLSKGATNSRNR